MEEIILDGRKMTTKETAHTYLKEQLHFPEYYGKNLDALWDMLSNYEAPISIKLLYREDIFASLGTYGIALVEVFEDAARESANFSFIS